VFVTGRLLGRMGLEGVSVVSAVMAVDQAALTAEEILPAEGAAPVGERIAATTE
jgi:hypothetical protein